MLTDGLGASFTPSSEMGSSATAASGVVVHAPPEQRVYHLPSCLGYDQVSTANMVIFPTEAAAKRAGYRKAKNCP